MGRTGPGVTSDEHRSAEQAPVEITVPDGVEDRLDRFLTERLPLSRTRIQGLIEGGHVRRLDHPDAVLTKRDPVAPGERYRVDVPAPEPVDLEPEDLPLPVVYQDHHLAVVDKPAGMVTHPAPGHRTGTMVNALLHHLDGLSGVGGRLRPGIVHRLDRETSGLLVVAKTDPAHHALQDALRTRSMTRRYTTVSWGHLEQDRLRIEAPIGRHPTQRTRMAVVDDGRPAVTHVEVRERWPAADLSHVTLETGRTHQIRVHLLHVGHPVAGDPVYGAGWNRGISGRTRSWAKAFAALLNRQFLHASYLRFPHPRTGEAMSFSSELPADLAAALAWARNQVA